MSISLLTTPQLIMPAYNPVLFTFSGTNNAATGYRYLVDVYSTDTNQRISRQLLSPQIDGSGKVDISRILSNYVTVSFNPNNNSIFNATNSYFNYYVQIGEELTSPSWPFTVASTYSASTALPAVTRMSGATTHNYVIDDQIVITPTGNYVSGLHRIIAIPNSKSIVIGTNFQNTLTGSTTYADNRKVRTSNITGYTGTSIFNGVQSFIDNISYDDINYFLSAATTTNKALTNLPNNFYTTYTNDLKVNFYINKAAATTYSIRTQDDLGNTGLTYSITGTTLAVSQLNCGPTALLVSFNASYYDFWLVKSGTTQLTKKYRVNIDKRCRISNAEVAFQDRMGSINSFAFQLRQIESGNISRIDYNQQVPDAPNTYDRGQTNVFIDVNKEYTLTTNWMTDEMSVYFEELLTSPYTWVKFDGVYQACVILDTSFVTERQANKKLIQKTIKIRLSNQNIINI